MQEVVEYIMNCELADLVYINDAISTRLEQEFIGTEEVAPVEESETETEAEAEATEEEATPANEARGIPMSF